MKTKKLFLTYAVAALMLVPIVSKADFSFPKELRTTDPSSVTTGPTKDQIAAEGTKIDQENNIFAADNMKEQEQSKQIASAEVKNEAQNNIATADVKKEKEHKEHKKDERKG